jgi:hypothetical protein
MQIVSNPERVCLEHALEFWTGLLVYAKDHSDPCVRQERLCTCRLCEGLSELARRGAPHHKGMVRETDLESRLRQYGFR